MAYSSISVLPTIALNGFPGPNTVGNPITLTCEVEGGFPVVDMTMPTAWYRDGEPVIGATGRVLSLTAEMEMDGVGYACSVTNDAGEAVSEELVLIVGGEQRSARTKKILISPKLEPIHFVFLLSLDY